MGLIIEGVFALALILLAVWLFSLRGSLARDQVAAQERQRQEQEAQQRAAREARLFRQGEALRCLGCGHTFLGPLPDTGCPQCHLSALVVTERDYQEGQQAAQRLGRTEKEG